ncbi:MAG: response regulator [Bacteroidales bacterium]|nr:response regulator [Bacteroidales bacterium]
MSKGKLLFIVDDDPFITMLVEKRFTPEGFRVVAFDYGEDCLKEISQNPDLIILDYLFHRTGGEVMNGMEVLDKIKNVSPDTPVIMLSGQDKGEVVLELARKGIEDYVIKDNNLIDNLNKAIREILSR